MPLFLLLVGVVLVVTGVRGTTEQLGTLLKGDFTGPGNFTTWLFAILLIGALSYVPDFQEIAYGLLLLVIVAVFLEKGQGFFGQLSSAMQELNT